MSYGLHQVRLCTPM